MKILSKKKYNQLLDIPCESFKRKMADREELKYKADRKSSFSENK